MQPVIHAQYLNHHFGDGALKKQVLFDINLEIQRGEFVILTGPSGSGKLSLPVNRRQPWIKNLVGMWWR